jgi:hypothetical protein
VRLNSVSALAYRLWKGQDYFYAQKCWNLSAFAC